MTVAAHARHRRRAVRPDRRHRRQPHDHRASSWRRHPLAARASSCSPSTRATSSTRSTSRSPSTRRTSTGRSSTTLIAHRGRRTACVIVAGLVERAGDGKRVRNTVVAVDGDGVLARYRKLHLYDAFGQRESDWVEPGELGERRDLRGRRPALRADDLLRPAVPRGRATARRCRRRRLPRPGRVGARTAQGAPLAHPRSTARAIENTVFVAAADHPPPLGVGHSMIVDPQGVEIAAVGTAHRRRRRAPRSRRGRARAAGQSGAAAAPATGSCPRD